VAAGVGVFRDRLPNVRIGGDGPTPHPDVLRATAAAIPGAALTVLPCGGHGVVPKRRAAAAQEAVAQRAMSTM